MNKGKTVKLILVVLAIASLVVFAEAQSVEEDNKALIRHANEEILNQGNLTHIDEVFAPDFVLNGVQLGPGAIRQFLTEVRTAFPDLRVTLSEMVAEGDRVAWQRTHSGTQRGEYMGIPASNQKVTWRAIIISRIVDGKIVEEWAIDGFQQQHQKGP